MGHTLSLEELQSPCLQCGHQIAVHTGDGGRSRTGSWGTVFDRAWKYALGACNAPVEGDAPGTTAPCGCTSRCQPGKRAAR
jgi:hypothetical protein